MDDILTLIIAARDNASATLARTSKEVRGLGGSAAKTAGPMGKLSAATGGLISPLSLAIGGATALTAGMIAATGAAAADEKSQALLKAALEANLPAYEGNTDAIEKVIESRMRLGFADDEQREGLRQLVAVTRDSSKALDLQRTAMDLARLRGIDLTTASTLLGKVYGGNVGILARYGIQLEKGTTATEALAEIQRRAAGQAEAYGTTLSGQAESIGIQFGELGEKIGYVVTGPLTGMLSGLNDLTDSLGEAGAATGRFLRPMAQFIREAGDAKEAYKALGNEISDASSAMTEEWAGDWKRMAGTVTTEGGFIVSQSQDIASDAGAALGETPKLAGQAILENQFHFNDAVDELREYMENYLTPAQEKVRIKAFLTSKAVADGLASGRPAIVRATQRAVDEAEARWEMLTGRVYGIGRDVAFSFGSGLLSGDNYVRDAAGTLRQSVQGALEFSGSPAYTHSRHIGEEVARTYGEGLNTGLDKVRVPGLPGMDGGGYAGAGAVVVNINSTFPPTPAQADEIARRLFPSMERQRKRQH